MKSKNNRLLIFLALIFAVAGIVLKVKSDQSAIHILCPKNSVKLFQKLIDYYEAEESPRISIIGADDEDYNKAVAKNLAGNHPADLVVLTPETDSYSEANLSHLRDLGSLPELKDSAILLAEGEALPILPLCGETPVIYYNADLLAEECQPVPHTARDFSQLCYLLQDERHCSLGMVMEHQSMEQTLSPLVESIVLTVVDQSDLKNQLAHFASMVDYGVFNQKFATSRNQLIEGFQNGSYAMIVGYRSEYAEICNSSSSFQVGSFYVPAERGDSVGALIPALSVGVSSTANEKAEEFVSYLLSDMAQKLIADGTEASPVRGAVDEKEKQMPGVSKFRISLLSTLPPENRMKVVGEFAHLVAGETVDIEFLETILLSSNNSEGDNP